MAEKRKRKDPAAVSLGRRGGKKKVPKGFAVLDKAARSQKAQEGAKARWNKSPKKQNRAATQ